MTFSVSSRHAEETRHHFGIRTRHRWFNLELINFVALGKFFPQPGAKKMTEKVPEYIIVIQFIMLALAMLIGFASIYLGYRLFAQIPIETTSDGHFKMPRFGEVKLKAAPGIFFAVFGTIIIIFVLTRPEF